MEQVSSSSEPPHTTNNTLAGNEAVAGGSHSKRLKELENAALQTSLITRTETDSAVDAGSDTEAEQQQEAAAAVSKQRLEEERTLTDHLNKRLLSSFLDKLNQRDRSLPGVQQLDCAAADEDSNRAAEEW